MIKYTIGDILKSDADCLVNTVNCEGYMGKRLAYQFKLKYPQNNIDYVKACNNKTLTIGKLHFFAENGRLIINFPTKDKWREKSKMEYIEKGLDELSNLILNLNIKSIAIPPLGCGNGGLKWEEVKETIEKKLFPVSNYVDIIIYEPSKNYKSTPKASPKMNISHLILMQMKLNLNKFNSLRLQKTAYFMNIFLGEKYFKFSKHKYGPYANSIKIVSRQVKEFQQIYNTKSTEEAYNIALNILVSSNIENKMNKMLPATKHAILYVNDVESDKQIECISTILYIIENATIITEEDIIVKFKLWSKDKAERFSEQDIRIGIDYLIETNIITKTLVGYDIRKYQY